MPYELEPDRFDIGPPRYLCGDCGELFDDGPCPNCERIAHEREHPPKERGAVPGVVFEGPAPDRGECPF